MDADTLIAEVRDVYARARLYSDKGSLKVNLDRGATIEVEFETAFERPDRFAFSFRKTLSDGTGFEHTDAYRVECERGMIRMGDPEWRNGRPESLGSAIASYTGISAGAAHRIPRLLMAERIGGVELFDAPERALLGDRVVDGCSHHVIELRLTAGITRVLVAPATLVIGAIEEQRYGVTQTVEYRAVLTPASDLSPNR